MRYILGFLATLGLIILVLVLLLRGGSSAPTPKSLNLADYAKSNSVAHFVLDGPVVADQNHQEVKIDVDANTVTFSLYDGYEGNLVKSQTYPNNLEAYTTFLRALQNEGFTKGNPDPKLSDERGFCPLGQRKVYAFENGSDQLMRYWSTSCDAKTFNGKANNVTLLFERQVPDYNKLTEDSKLNIL